MPMPRPRPITLLIPLSALALGACQSSPGAESSPRAAVTLSVADFADASATVTRPEPVETEPTRVASNPDLSTSVGAPGRDNTPRTGERVVMDRVVGQVNGKPIYAEQFYRDSERRWREESKTKSQREWANDLSEYTQATLYRTIREELLLAEFRSSLTQQQKAGVLSFVEGLRKEEIRLAGGSEAAARRKFLEEQGIDLDEGIKNKAEREFIFQQLRSSIGRRVQVSSRDIELYYNRNIRQFKPLPVYVFRQVFTEKDNEARVAELTDIFSSDAPVPESLGIVSRVELDEGGVENASFFSAEWLNEHARTLRPGESAGPIERGDNLWWLHLDAIEQGPQLDLYDVQLQIEQAIRTQRFGEEESRYFEKLLERSNVSEINTMIEKLMDYAIARLYVPDDKG